MLALLDDRDSGVRKVALRSAPAAATAAGNALGAAPGAPLAALRAKVEALATADPEPRIRDLARKVLGQLPPASP